MLVAFLLALEVLTGCAAAQPETPSRAQATEALRQATEVIEQARAQAALWTTAHEALAQAQRAFEQGDFGSAMQFANIAREQARLGLAQRTYPPLRY